MAALANRGYPFVQTVTVLTLSIHARFEHHSKQPGFFGRAGALLRQCVIRFAIHSDVQDTLVAMTL